MAELPQNPNSVVKKIYEYYETKAGVNQGRQHLGASEIGGECERALWYGFRWASWISFPGRMLRLFETGQLNEERLASAMQAIGITIHLFDSNGKQFSFREFGGHFSGSMDGCALGVFAAPKTWHILEFKTINAKGFATLSSKGVQKAKPEHYAQMQIYMHYMGLTRALYLVENKDNSDIYEERVKYDAEIAIKLVAKAKRIVFSPNALPKISDSPESFKCQWCAHNPVCHGGQMARMNCRTCLYSTPTESGTWVCEKKKTILDVATQRTGCSDHLWIPSLVPYEQIDATDDSVIYRNINGEKLVNLPGGKLEHAE